MVKKGGEWKEVSWEMALEMAAASLKEIGDGDQIGTLLSPTSTLEELFLAQKLMRGLGCNNIDSRLRQGDFRDDPAQDPGLLLAALEILVNLLVQRNEKNQGHRYRTAAEHQVLDFLDPVCRHFQSQLQPGHVGQSSSLLSR